MKITVDNFELRLDIEKVDHFEYEDECNNPDIDQFTVQVRYILNGEEIDAHGSLYTIRDMVKYGITKLNKMYNSFELCPYQMEIFTCTCGQPGCAGLHYPISVKNVGTPLNGEFRKINVRRMPSSKTRFTNLQRRWCTKK